ncbi:MAG: right-handed parallel beta-helix repeat-containing protein, partial [Candidatus Thermoplasmatota archaeon]|nr:right-handed parallel beta-helix repeat-containing protein [Candidatus Thermoplasmatota archaeon]MBU1941177.1 right-handed parallel beta-helix repeat-containing protein [Candidatus Thermoplasmatota archaeon]
SALTHDITTQTTPIMNRGTLYVGGSGPGNYSKIQTAIDAASQGDTIFVYDDSSPYNENIKITKSIQLIGENRDTTIINGMYNYFNIELAADTVTISGFNLINAIFGISGTTSGSELSQLRIEGTYYMGYGMILSYSSKNLISDNIIDGHGGYYLGLYLDTNCSRNTLVNNTIQYTIWAIEINRLCNGNIIKENTIAHNYIYGLDIFFSFFNIITKNNFIDNDIQSYFDRSSLNLWWGNYWDDWTSTDKRPIDGIRYGLFTHEKKNYTTYDWRPAQEPYTIGI